MATTQQVAASEENDASSKVFTVNDIQTLIDNQLLHKSQLDQNLENNKLEQRLILVTDQNGDKIILIQSPTVGADSQPLRLNSSLGGESSLNSLSLTAATSSATMVQASAVANIVDTSAIADKQLALYDSESDTEFLLSNPAISNLNEDEENEKDEEISRIQLQHKHRQQSLMLQLERLREKHRQTRTENEEDAEAEQPSDDSFWEFNIDEINEYEQQKSNHKPNRQHVKKKSVPLEKFYCEAKWYPSFCNNLEKAHNYVRRRSENVEQLSKYFPNASYAFESRCAELKKHLKKLELNLERFQNVLGKDLNFVENKLKNFFQDYHLEQFSAVIEDEDRKDLEESLDNQFFSNIVNSNSNQPTASPSKASFASSSQLNHHHNCSSVASTSNSHRNSLRNSSFIPSKIELITPMSISITPAEQQHDEIDPVPEIRDVRCDASLEEMGNWYSNNVNLSKPSSYASNVSIKTKKANVRRTKEAQLKPAKQQKRS